MNVQEFIRKQTKMNVSNIPNIVFEENTISVVNSKIINMFAHYVLFSGPPETILTHWIVRNVLAGTYT